MSKSPTTSFHCDFDVIVLSSAGFSSMIEPLQFRIWVIFFHSLNNLVVLTKLSIGVLLVHEVNSDQIAPLHFVYLIEVFDLNLLWKPLQCASDNSNRKERVIFLYLFVHRIDYILDVSNFFLLYKLPVFIILSHGWKN